MFISHMSSPRLEVDEQKSLHPYYNLEPQREETHKHASESQNHAGSWPGMNKRSSKVENGWDAASDLISLTGRAVWNHSYPAVSGSSGTVTLQGTRLVWCLRKINRSLESSPVTEDGGHLEGSSESK